MPIAAPLFSPFASGNKTKGGDLEVGDTTISPGQQYQNTQGTSQGTTYYSDPAVAQALTHLGANVAQETGSQYADFVNDPTSHPIYQNALSGLMGSLEPSENAARRNLNDQFRAAGNTSSSSFAHGASGLESDILRNRQTTASNLLTTLFPQVANALYQPLSQAPALIQANKLEQQTAQNSTQSGSVQQPKDATQGAPSAPNFYYDNTGMAAARGGPGSLRMG